MCTSRRERAISIVLHSPTRDTRELPRFPDFVPWATEEEAIENIRDAIQEYLAAI